MIGLDQVGSSPPLAIPPYDKLCLEGSLDLSFWIATSVFPTYEKKGIQRHIFISSSDDTYPCLSIIIADHTGYGISAVQHEQYMRNKLVFKAYTHLYNHWLLKKKVLASVDQSRRLRDQISMMFCILELPLFAGNTKCIQSNLGTQGTGMAA